MIAGSEELRCSRFAARTAASLEFLTKGYADGVINNVKVDRRRAYGLPTFDRVREGAPGLGLTGSRGADPPDRREPNFQQARSDRPIAWATLLPPRDPALIRRRRRRSACCRFPPD